MVQWLRLHASNNGVQIRFLVGELRSHMLCGHKTKIFKLQKKKKGKKRNILKN